METVSTRIKQIEEALKTTDPGSDSAFHLRNQYRCLKEMSDLE